ncbi:hypothetical protein [Microbulbifer epialgicus]|uniref:Uncharacterized protein n=1 Tax=Microbulbifer epialgicus TaxID=393907 RepID=A0ABV4NTB5_9GAMM
MNSPTSSVNIENNGAPTSQNDSSIGSEGKLKALLTAVNSGDFNLVSEKQSLNLEKEKLETGFSGNRVIDGLLKTDDDKAQEKDFTARRLNDISTNGAHTLSDQTLQSEIDDGGRSLDPEKVLIALQGGHVSVEVCQQYFKGKDAEDILSICEDNLVRHNKELGKAVEANASKELADRDVLQRAPIVEKWEEKLRTNDLSQEEPAPKLDSSEPDSAEEVATQNVPNSNQMQQTNLVGAVGHAFGRILNGVFAGVGMAIGASVNALKDDTPALDGQDQLSPRTRFSPAALAANDSLNPSSIESWKKERVDSEFKGLQRDIENQLESIQPPGSMKKEADPTQLIDRVKDRTTRLSEMLRDSQSDTGPLEASIHEWQEKAKKKFNSLSDGDDIQTGYIMDKINAVLDLFRAKDKQPSMALK